MNKLKRETNQKMVILNGVRMAQRVADFITANEQYIRDMDEKERLNIPDMCARFAVSEGTMRKYLEILKLTLHNYRPCPFYDKKDWKNRIPKMLAKGMLYKDIALKLGTSHSTVCRWVCDNGLGKRNLQ